MGALVEVQTRLTSQQVSSGQHLQQRSTVAALLQYMLPVATCSVCNVQCMLTACRMLSPT
jgi:hypothetical protein